MIDLAAYLTKGVEHITGDVVRATLKNPAESFFMARFVKSLKSANKRRELAEAKGEHIPAFLIASITISCNLHCAGCYARANQSCSDCVPVQQLTAKDWSRIFKEARELGIRFIILIGGEPMLRRDVIDMASQMDDVMFPVFTNGTLIDEQYLQVFDRHRNIVPIISIEGKQTSTDYRRGNGVFQKIMDSMEWLRDGGIIFGASITVTRNNLEETMSEEFINQLQEKGCKIVFYVEYVPTSEGAKALALMDEERKWLMSRLQKIRKERDEMVFIAFPGDEKSSGGCLAAGRGFFHINSHGGAEPCPFSNYSDINVKDTSVREALRSGLFMELQNGDILRDEHQGGCVLYEKREQVAELANKKDKIKGAKSMLA